MTNLSPYQIKNLRQIAKRIFNSSVVWSWVFNGLRLASGILLLPLLLRPALLPTPDFGMYCVFLGLGALLPIIDFGFSASIARSISYAMGGATELKAEGIVPSSSAQSGPNFSLLHQLLYAVRMLYRYLSLITFVLLGTAGTMVVGLRVHETHSPAHTWLAWSLVLVAAILEIYAGWWNVFLRGMNQVLLSARLAVLAYALNLILACGLLLSGAGLLSVPIASLLSSLLQRHLARRHCLRLLGDTIGTKPEASVLKSLLATFWPNSWRLGLQLLTGYLSINIIIYLKMFNLADNAQYGLSMRIISFIQGMATVWIFVKWPLLGQYRTRQDFRGLRRVIWPRLWLQFATFIFLATIGIIWGSTVLEWWCSGKKLLPVFWLTLLALNCFLEMQFSFWGTLIATENRMPFVWPTIASNLFSLCLVIFLAKFTSLGLGALVLGPLVAGSLFNYWYWPIAGAKTLQTNWARFTFSRPH